MKVKRKEWEALQAKLADLEQQLRDAHRGTLMNSRTGPVLLNVVVPMILDHLRVESRHGYGWLQPIEQETLTRADMFWCDEHGPKSLPSVNCPECDAVGKNGDPRAGNAEVGK